MSDWNAMSKPDRFLIMVFTLAALIWLILPFDYGVIPLAVMIECRMLFGRIPENVK